MDFENKAFIIGVNIRDLENYPSSEHLIADVVIIDQSHNILKPLLFQVKPQALDMKNASQHRNAFAMLGEVISIDKEKKNIYLQNHITVAYKHLIIASGLQTTPLGLKHEEDLANGLNALLEALKVRKNLNGIPYLGEIRKIDPAQTQNMHFSQVIPQDKLLFQLLQSINFPMISGIRQNLNTTNKKLFEVRLDNNG